MAKYLCVIIIGKFKNNLDEYKNCEIFFIVFIQGPGMTEMFDEVTELWRVDENSAERLIW